MRADKLLFEVAEKVFVCLLLIYIFNLKTFHFLHRFVYLFRHMVFCGGKSVSKYMETVVIRGSWIFGKIPNKAIAWCLYLKVLHCFQTGISLLYLKHVITCTHQHTSVADLVPEKNSTHYFYLWHIFSLIF